MNSFNNVPHITELMDCGGMGEEILAKGAKD
jgi:hypothetical protein